MKNTINSKNIISFIIRYNTLFTFIVMLIASAMVSDVFFSSGNLFNLIRQVSPVGIISMGMLLVILTGGIDLSVGSIVAMIAVLCALFTHNMPLPLAVISAVGCGLLVGGCSGYLVAGQKVAPFIATLALMSIVRGLSFIFSKGAPIMVHDSATALTDFGADSTLGLPNPAWIFLLVFVLMFVILKYNFFGRIILAIGSNEEAVSLSGIKVPFYKFAVYVVIGGLASLAGIISTARTSVGSPVIGVSLELDVIAAVVIGGASLKGGKGSVINTLLGVLILGMIGNIMNLLDIPSYSQQVIKGLIIVLAVLLQKYQDRY